jgi:structural maintenance of chromosome 2
LQSQITGPKGISKSNILNLSEVIYRQGQAGIGKGSFLAIFNNISDEANSPVGHEVVVIRQISNGVKQEFINLSPTNQVTNLFYSL